MNVSPVGVRSSKSRLQTWLSNHWGIAFQRRKGESPGPEQDTPRTGAEQGKGKRSGLREGTSQRVAEQKNGDIPQKSTPNREQAGQEFKKQASSDELAKEGPPTLGEVYNAEKLKAEKQFTFPESKPELEDKDKGQVPGRISQAADQLQKLRESGVAAASLVALVKILIASNTDQQLSALEGLSRINGAQAILESLGKDIDSPGLVFLPLIELSKEKLEKAIQYLQPAGLIMALTQHKTWKSFFPEVMPEANKFLINKLSPPDQDRTTHPSGGQEPTTAPLCSPHSDGSSPKKGDLSGSTVTKLVEIIIEPNTEQQLSVLEGLSQIDGAQAILESLSKDIDSPGLVFLPLIELSKEKLEKAIQYLQPAGLIMALTQHKTWKSSFPEVMERANKFLKDKLSASDQDLTTHLSSGPEPNTHATSGSPPYKLSRAVPLSESLLPLSRPNGKGPIRHSSSASEPLGSVRQSSSQRLSSHSSSASAPVGESSAENPVRMLVAMITTTETRQLALQNLLSMNSAQKTLQSLSEDIKYPVLADLWDKLSPLDDPQTLEDDLDDLKKIIQDLNPQVLITKIIENKKWSSSLSSGRIVRARQFLAKLAKQAEIAVVKQLIQIGVTSDMGKQLQMLKELTQMQNAQQALQTVNRNIDKEHQGALEELLQENKWEMVQNCTDSPLARTAAWFANQATNKKAIINSLLSHYSQDLSQDIVTQATNFLS